MAYPIYSIVALAAILTIATTLIQKKFTDQEHLKALKKRQKEIQKEIKKTKDPTIMQELNAEMLQLTGIMFKSSMKPMFVTIIPILLIISWAHANIEYNPILPGDNFSVQAFFDVSTSSEAEIVAPKGIEIIGNATAVIEDGKAEWMLRGDVGKYNIKVLYSGDSVSKDLVITDGADYAKVQETYKGEIEKILIGNKKRVYLNLFGWKLGWLGSYIFLSILFSMILRKGLKVV